MKKIVIMLMVATTLVGSSCTNSSLEEVDKSKKASTEVVEQQLFKVDDIFKLGGVKGYEVNILRAINKSGNNGQELLKALTNAPTSEEREGVAFLISFMPERDLRTLSAAFILENVKWAYKTKTQFSWSKNVPKDIFLNDVLPYAILNERRDDWRADFNTRFTPIVEHCKTMEEAIYALNKNIMKELKVKYSTKREKADQSPYETMASGIASCSGLSIILTDAFRSVGIPSRVAGIPLWPITGGNHNWNEVWLDRDKGWHLTEFYLDQKGLDYGWLIERAAKADHSKWEHRIYASSFTPTEYWFPLVWDMNIRFVNGVNVSSFYKGLWQKIKKEKEEIDKALQPVAMIVFESENGPRVATKITIKQDGKTVHEGKTRKPTDDMNNVLTFKLKKGEAFTVEYLDSANTLQSQPFKVVEGEKVQEVQLFLKQ